MTMISAVKQQGCGYLYSDTAYVDVATGKVMAFAPKVLTGTAFPWAVGMTFCGPCSSAARGLFRETADVDGLVTQIPQAIATYRRNAAASGYERPAVRVVVVAWDERCQTPRIFFAGDGLDAYPSTSWCPPGVREAEYFFGGDFDPRRYWWHQTPNDPQFFDVARDGLALYEERRRVPFTPDGMPLGHYIGGELQLTQVGRLGTTTTVLRKWPDEIGQPIMPEPELASGLAA
jgi:hypothetical protein